MEAIRLLNKTISQHFPDLMKSMVRSATDVVGSSMDGGGSMVQIMDRAQQQLSTDIRMCHDRSCAEKMAFINVIFYLL
jgi:hypothetical protein